MALIQIIYTSRATRAMSDADLDQIVASATRKNGINDISGMLLYADGNFMQVLEGEEAAVDATFERVEADPRHESVVVTERGPIEVRSYANWSMGFKRMGEDEVRAMTAVMPDVTPSPAVSTQGFAPGLAGAILRELSREAH